MSVMTIPLHRYAQAKLGNARDALRGFISCRKVGDNDRACVDPDRTARGASSAAS